MRARYQHRLYPTNRQQRDLARLRDRVGAFWNHTLTLGRDSEKLLVTGEPQKLGFTLGQQTIEREWLDNVSAIFSQQSINDLGAAYSNFFDSLKGNRKCVKVKLAKLEKRTNLP